MFIKRIIHGLYSFTIARNDFHAWSHLLEEAAIPWEKARLLFCCQHVCPPWEWLRLIHSSRDDWGPVAPIVRDPRFPLAIISPCPLVDSCSLLLERAADYFLLDPASTFCLWDPPLTDPVVCSHRTALLQCKLEKLHDLSFFFPLSCSAELSPPLHTPHCSPRAALLTHHCWLKHASFKPLLLDVNKPSYLGRWILIWMYLRTRPNECDVTHSE